MGGEGGVGGGAGSRVRSDFAGRKPGARGGTRERRWAGLSRAAAAAATATAHCAAGGSPRGRALDRRAPGDGEQGAPAPRVCRQPQEDEAAAGHRADRLRRL